MQFAVFGKQITKKFNNTENSISLQDEYQWHNFLAFNFFSVVFALNQVLIEENRYKKESEIYLRFGSHGDKLYDTQGRPLCNTFSIFY